MKQVSSSSSTRAAGSGGEGSRPTFPAPRQ
jgi:hypothetical protein